MRRPSGDNDGSNSRQGDLVRRLRPGPSALIDQTSWMLSKTIRPDSELMSIGDPVGASLVGEETTREPDGTTDEPVAPPPPAPEQPASTTRLRTTVAARIPPLRGKRTSGSAQPGT